MAPHCSVTHSSLQTTGPPWELFREFPDQIQDDLRCSRNKSIFKLPHKSRLDAFCSPWILITSLSAQWKCAGRQKHKTCILVRIIIFQSKYDDVFIFLLLCNQYKRFSWKKVLWSLRSVVAIQVRRTKPPPDCRSRHQLDNPSVSVARIAAAVPCDKLLSPCRLTAGSCCAADSRSCRHMQLSADQTGSRWLGHYCRPVLQSDTGG